MVNVAAAMLAGRETRIVALFLLTAAVFCDATALKKAHAPLSTSKDTCPLVGSTEHDYTFVAGIVKLLQDIGRPFYLGGASGMALLRFGALSLPSPNGIGPTMAFDRDLDFAVFSEDDADRRAFNVELQQGCKEAGIFKDCTDWFRINPNPSPQNNIKHADFYDLRNVEVGAFAGMMKVVNYGEQDRSWLIERDVLMPFQKAKYYDISIPVPRQAVRFFSEVMPHKPSDKYPEYGSGCSGMCYAPLVIDKLVGHTQLPEAVVRTHLEQCATHLQNSGFPSFSECFQPPTFLAKRTSVDCRPVWQMGDDRLMKVNSSNASFG